jgi:hypothetical protein
VVKPRSRTPKAHRPGAAAASAGADGEESGAHELKSGALRDVAHENPEELVSELQVRPAVLKNGLMLKQGTALTKPWNRRYFVLYAKPPRLVYYLLEEEAEQHVREALRPGAPRPAADDPWVYPDEEYATVAFAAEPGMRVVAGYTAERPSCFSVETEDRVWVFDAEDAVQLTEWLQALELAQALARGRLWDKKPVRPVEEALKALQQTLVYGDLVYDGKAFLRVQEGKFAEAALANVVKHLERWEQSLNDEQRPLAACMLAVLHEAVERGKQLVALLWARIAAQEKMDMYKAEEKATEIALGKGERELANAQQYWKGALALVEQIRSDPRFVARREPGQAPVYIADVAHFLEAFDGDRVAEVMNARMYVVGYARRPSIVKANTAALDRALYSVDQAARGCSDPFRGKPFLTAKRVAEVEALFGEAQRQFAEYKKNYVGDPSVGSYQGNIDTLQRRVAELWAREKVHQQIEVVQQRIAACSLSIAGRNAAKASAEWEAVKLLVAELNATRSATARPAEDGGGGGGGGGGGVSAEAEDEARARARARAATEALPSAAGVTRPRASTEALYAPESGLPLPLADIEVFMRSFQTKAAEIEAKIAALAHAAKPAKDA